MSRPDRYWLRGLALTLGLYVLVSVVLRYARERDWHEERRHGRHQG